MKKLLCVLLALLLCLLAGCGGEPVETPSEPESSNSEPEAEVEAKPVKTEVQNRETRYVPIDEVGTYDESIITAELLSSCTLEDLDKANLPYWTGYIMENKIFAAQEYDSAWEKYNAGAHYFCEDEVRYLAENGFNCVRVLYSFSILSNPDDVYSINVSELEQLDELISWCAKYNIHMMISITGVPGVHSDNIHDEDPAWQDTLFTDPAVEEAFGRYWDMISKRYAEIPNGLLSFEIVAEPCGVGIDESQPEAIVERYCEVLEPIALSMFEDRSDRIVFAMDIVKLVPEGLAEIGCCLSLHNHIYPINAQYFMNTYSVSATNTSWPIALVPTNMYDGEEIVIQCEEPEGFSEAVLSLTYHYFSYEPDIYADGELIPWRDSTGEHPKNESGALNATVPEGTKELKIVANEELGIKVIRLLRGYDSAAIASLYLGGDKIDFTPTFSISADSHVNCLNKETADFGNWDYMYETSISKFEECAKANGVSFVMTEVGTDTLSLSPEEYIAYHEDIISILKEHNIGWMYNCVHNILGPRYLIWLGGADGSIPFENFSDWGNYGYVVNDDVINLLKKYQ